MDALKAIPQRLRWIVVLIAIAAVAFLTYWIGYRYTHSITNDAFVESDMVVLAPKVSGQIVEMVVADSEHVTKGQLLFRIYPIPYREQIALDGYLTLRGYQTATVGWVAVPGALVLIATLLISGVISDRAHTLRAMQAGLIITTLSLFMLLQLDLYTSKEWIAGVLCLYSVGAGMVLPTGLRLLFEGRAPEAVQQLASVKVAVRFFAILVGFLVSSTILVRGTDWNQDQLRQKISRGRPAVEQVERQLARYAREGGSAPEVAANQATALIGSWVAINAQALGFRGVIRYFLVLSGLGFIVSLFITRGVEADILAGEKPSCNPG